MMPYSNKNILNDLKHFLKGVPVGIWLSMLFFIIIICALPSLLTLPGILDFTETGQIGDTIGGIMGPFIAILAALLTFIAFWAQFDANRELIKENRRNHFENRFYKMLDIHLENVVDLNKHVSDVATDSCFQLWCNEIFNLFNYLNIQCGFGGFMDYLIELYREDSTEQTFIEFLKKMQDSSDIHQIVIFEMTYAYFFTGYFATMKIGDKKETQHAIKFASIFMAYIKDNNTNNIDFLKGVPKNELLGRYYRHLFQIVKFVDEQSDDLFPELDWKKEFLGILRSQMSDYEQLLLYYNSQSSIGHAWNELHFIEKYKLIKNIPYGMIKSSVGISPFQMYQEEIKAVEAKGENFFECGCFS